MHFIMWWNTLPTLFYVSLKYLLIFLPASCSIYFAFASCRVRAVLQSMKHFPIIQVLTRVLKMLVIGNSLFMHIFNFFIYFCVSHNWRYIDFYFIITRFYKIVWIEVEMYVQRDVVAIHIDVFLWFKENLFFPTVFDSEQSFSYYLLSASPYHFHL